jgi:glycosyltransferase involved in cell wall biosynthesis
MTALRLVDPAVPPAWQDGTTRPGHVPGLTTVILTFNEAVHIARAIACARAFSTEVLVVDSYSTDATVAIARRMGARVVQNAWSSHARQCRFALEDCGIATEWVLRLDADEVIGPDLATRILAVVPTLPLTITGVVLNRRHRFMGRWIRHGGRYPMHLLRCWRHGLAEVEDRWMDEHVRLLGGRSVKIAGAFTDACERDLAFFTAKHNGYATREAVEVLARRYDLLPARSASGPAVRQARVKRWLKHNLYERLPLGVAPLAYFLHRYIVRLGFLDGRAGLVYHLLQGFWYRLLVQCRVLELDRALRGCAGREERLDALRRATGLAL